MAQRMLRALRDLFNECDPNQLSDADYDRIRGSVIERVREYGK
jgi:hypothetical protein